MATVIEELHALHRKLETFPEGAHWFCPKRFDEDTLNYTQPDFEEDDVSAETKKWYIAEARKREQVAYRFALVFGMDSGDSENAQEWLNHYTSHLTDFLTKCDKCVRNYHLGRKDFARELSEDLDDDTIAELLTRIEKFDFDRIDTGLFRAEQLLSSLPDMKRNMRSLTADPVALSGLYEALCCESYHKSPAKIFQPLGDVMNLVQTTRTLKISDVVPAMARFLFDSDHNRHQFAVIGWQRSDIISSSKIFDWVVHDSLTDAILMASAPTVTLPEMERFWAGTLLILQKLTPELITHSVRAMEVQPDLYHLALQHLSCNSDEILDNIIQVLSLLLKKSRATFWEAFGTISPATVAEQIFNCPAFERLLARSHNQDSPDDVHIPDAISWVTPFIEALDSHHQYELVRFVLFNLLTRFQMDQIPQDSRLACCYAGMRALLATLMTFTAADYSFRNSTAFIHINNLLGLVDKYKDVIVNCATLSSNDKEHAELTKVALQVVRYSLSLDCKAHNAERQFLDSNESVNHGLDSHSQSIWQTVLDSFRPNSIEMAKSVLAGITPHVGIEPFRLNSDTALLKDKTRFNKDFEQLMEVVTKFLERLSDFSPANLRILCKSPSTAHPLIATLSSPHEPTYEAAVEVIKTMTGKETRKDAFLALLEEFLETSLMATTFAAKRVIQSKGFVAISRALKTGNDVLDSLCDTQHGILRTSTSRSIREKEALRVWWSEQWRLLEVSYGMTEKWSRAHSSEAVTGFCRDAMDYSEALFDQNGLLTTVLGSTNGEDSYDKSGTRNEAIRKDIFKEPLRAVGSMVRWLRLKDAYLLSTIVDLLSKLLRRLGGFDMHVNDDATRYLEACAKATVGEGVRTYLTPQQKAELIKALEEHHGLEQVEPRAIPNVFAHKKQSTIDAWSKSAAGNKVETSAPSGFKSQKEMIDLSQWKNNAKSSRHDLDHDVLSLSTSLEKQQSSLDQMRSRQQQITSSLRKDIASKTGESIKLSREREKEEKRQRDAAAVAKAKALRTGGLTSGEGSALKGLGVLGKDHAPPKGEIMVSSDEESSEDDDVEVSTLILKNRDSKKASEYEERKRALKQLPPQGPVRKTKIIRSAKDMRARLVPDMSILHLNILSWNIFHESDEPPSAITCSKVSDTFLTHIDYRDTFYPLLISEAWRSFRTAKEESSSRPFPIKIVNRMSVDQFYEVSTTMLIAENRDLNLLEGDIVLLSKSEDPLKDASAPHCLARIYRITRKKDVLEVSYRVNGAAATGRVNGANAIDTPLLPSLAPNVTIRGYKITSMTTIEREYAALNSLQYYDLCEEILEARPSPLLPYSRSTLAPIQQNYGVNMGQAKAIWSAKENDAFTLIQGPPGSGKTKTIVAMVGALLTDSFGASGVAIDRPQSMKPQNVTTKPLQKKLLICAPSNAAVDELVMRLKEGVKTLRGEVQKINVIRLGRSDAINASVKDVTLDELVRLKLEGDPQNGKGIASQRDGWHKEAGAIKEQLSVLRPQLDKAVSDGDKALELRLQREIDNKKREQARLGAKIDADKDSGNTVARENEIKRRMFQQQILDSAHVLCSTLSGSGHEMFRNLNVEFETVIIDEAAQCIELSALIPLKYGCSKCILVGDPKQLPPTVLSSMAARYGYEQSLFVRMQQNHPESVHLLDTQYRMHPQISLFPSKQFYDAKLLDGEGMAVLREKPWHLSSLLGPYRFFDVKGTQLTGSKGHSYINSEEVSVAMQLYERLRIDYKSYDFRGKIGIITPYKAQLAELRGRFRTKYGDDIFDEVDFNTTDAFQGRESEIIIFSCVRARATGGIGFLDDIRRMNVGLTRAKSSLWVLGDSQSLLQGEFWNKLIKDAQARQLYTKGDVLGLLKKPLNRERTHGAPKPPGSTGVSIDSLPGRDQDGRSQSSKTPKLEENHQRGNSPGSVDVEMIDVSEGSKRIPNETISRKGRDTKQQETLENESHIRAVRDSKSSHGSSRLHEALMNESLARQKPTVQPTLHTPADAEAFLERRGSFNDISSGKRERPESSAEDPRPSKRKIPTGPRAPTQNFNTRAPARHQDVAAMSLLSNAAKSSSSKNLSSTSNDRHNLAASTDGAGPRPIESSKPNENVDKPIIVRKRHNADPLRRNLQTNRHR